MALEREAAVSHVAPPIPSSRLVPASLPPPTSSDSQDSGYEVGEALGDRDLRSHIWSLSTKEDLERFATRVKALRQDIENLQAETTQLGGRVESIENRLDDMVPTMQALNDSLLDQLDYENRSHRVNIRIRGLPKETASREIVPT